MRLWPVAGAGSGRVVQQDIEYKGMTIPKGTKCQIYFYAMFRQPWIDRPHEFIPERWSESNPQSQDLKDMLMPFSLGKRSCIGQNMAMQQLRLLVANLMLHYEFELAEKVKHEIFLTLKPQSLRMTVKART